VLFELQANVKFVGRAVAVVVFTDQIKMMTCRPLGSAVMILLLLLIPLLDKLVDDFPERVGLAKPLFPIDKEFLSDNLLQILHIAALFMNQLLDDLAL
jgi:hypothetical protein